VVAITAPVIWFIDFMAASFAESPSQEETIIRLPLDVTNPESCKAFTEKAMAISSRVDALVCAAAVLVLGSCEHTSCEEYSRVMETNFVGTTRMVQYALPMMRQQNSGRIILFSSINGLLGIPFQSAYTASKHAMEGYAECLAMETRRFGIQVCLVEPGDHQGGSNHTRLHAIAEDEQSVYHSAYESACAAIHRDESGGLLPDALGQKVVRNVQRRHMRFRLRVAKFDQHLAVWLHRYMPNWINSLILRIYYGADKANH
jgi:NAD(P)-dependent dehydrogenase (short-subunit alcohol dehydrogenase family)